MTKNYEVILFKITAFKKCSRSMIMPRETTDYRSKFMVCPTSQSLLSYGLKGPRKGWFPLPFTNVHLQGCACMHCSTHRADLLSALSLSLTKWLVSTDGDEVSGKFFIIINIRYPQ